MNAKYIAGCAGIFLFALQGASAQFLNQSTTPGELISKSHPELGRLTTIEVLGDYIIAIPEIPSSTAEGDFIVRALDISDPANPVTVQTFGRTAQPILAHGTYKRGNEVYLGGFPNDAVRLEEDGSLTHTRWSGPDAHFNKSGMMHPWAARHWWSYGNVTGLSWLQLDGEVTAEWDHLGMTGVIGFPAFMGNLMLYASDQSFSGMAAYDVSDPTNPVLLDVLKLPEIHPTLTRRRFINGAATDVPIQYGLGGYWSEIYGHYMVFARRLENPGIQIVDFSDPTNLRVHCEILYRDPSLGLDLDFTTGPTYLGFQDEYVFSEQLKVNIETCEVELHLDEVEAEIETSQYSRPIGNLLLTGGGHNFLIEGQGIASGGLGIWGHQAEPDRRAPFVAYHIPQADQTNYPLMAPISFMIPETLRTENIVIGENIKVSEVGGEDVPIDYLLSHTGVLTVDPLENLKPSTTYEVTLVGLEDAVHNVMDEFTFRFSTGDEVVRSVPQVRAVNVSPRSTVILNEAVTVSLLAIDADGDPLEYRFRRSAGEAYSDWSSSNTATFSYDEAGTYQVTIQVRDTPSNNVVTSVANIAVVETLAVSESSLKSGPMALTQDGENVWVANPDNNTVSQLSVTNHQKTSVGGTGEIFVGEDPRSVAVDSNDNVWVTLHDEDAIAILDPAGNRIETIETGYGSAPVGIVMNREGTFAYVSLYNSGEVIQIDTATMTVLPQRAQNLPTVKALALTNDGNQLLATRFISDQNWGEVWLINTTTMTVSRVIKLDQSLEPDDIDNGRGVPNQIASVIIDADDKYAYVVGKKDNTAGGFVNENVDLDDDNTVRTFAAQIDLLSGLELRERRIDFDNADSPSSLALLNNGAFLLAGLQGTNQVFVINRDVDNGNLGSAASRIATGLAPQGLLFDSFSEQLMVKNLTDRTVSFVDLSDFLLGSIVNPDIETVSTVENELLSDEVLLGKQIFYNAVLGLDSETAENRALTSAEGYLSCATCHLDGDSDARVWDFTGRGEGLRNNITLNGRMGTRFGFVHWSGNFDEIHDFEIDIRERFRGRGLMTDQQYTDTGGADPLASPKAGVNPQLDALVAYVNSLGQSSIARSPFREDNGELTEAGQRGFEVFTEAGCVNCHTTLEDSGSFTMVGAFTDGAIRDIGTTRSYSGSRLNAELPGLKTPSLLGVFHSAPYLHDGSAETLEDVFTTVGGEVFQAETASISGDAAVVEPEAFSYLRGGAGVRIGASSSVEFSDVTNAAFEGYVRVRYGSLNEPASMMLTIGDQEYVRELEVLPTVGGEDVNFRELTFAVSVPAGTSDAAVTIESESNTATVVIDDITVSTPESLARNAPHQAFNSLTVGDKEDLLEFLSQIDGNNAPADDAELNIVTTIVESTENPNAGGSSGSSSGGQTPEEETGNDPVVTTPEETVNSTDPVTSSSGGGSGSSGPLALLLLPLLWRVRKKLAQKLN